MNRKCIERKNATDGVNWICVDWDTRVFQTGIDQSTARRLIEQAPVRFYEVQWHELLCAVIQLLDASPDLASTLDNLNVSVATRLSIEASYREHRCGT